MIVCAAMGADEEYGFNLRGEGNRVSLLTVLAVGELASELHLTSSLICKAWYRSMM